MLGLLMFAGFQLVATTTTARLGEPIIVNAIGPKAMELDLERSTTDTYSLSIEEKKEDPEAAVWKLRVIPLAIGPLPLRVFWKNKPEPVVGELNVQEPQLPPDAEIADIKKPAAARRLLWPWLLALGLMGAAVYAGKRLMRKNGAHDTITEPPDARAPHVIALEELGALEGSELWTAARYKEFYAALTAIVRRYLERRYGMPALKLTTWELTRQLRQAEADRKAVSLFKDIFDGADLVKFAKTTPAPDRGILDLSSARTLIELTSPQELAVKTGGGA